jgi:hypothetical protein
MKDANAGFSMEKIADMLFPVLLAAVGWLLSEITSFQNRLIAIESKIPILITNEGVIIDSPQSASARQEMKDDLMHDIHDLQVRVKLMEERQK